MVNRDPIPHGDKLRHTDQKTLDGFLRTAAEHGNIDYMQELIEVGGNVKEGALIFAVRGKQTETIQTLLAMGEDVNMDYGRITPLVCAVEMRSPEIVKMLLAAGADVNKADECGITPLMATQVPENLKTRKASRLDAEIAQILKEAGSHDPLPVDQLPTLIRITGRCGNWVRHAGIDWLNSELAKRSDWSYFTPIEKDEVEDMLAIGADVNQALMFSLLTSGQSEFVEMCMAAGADANYQDGYYPWRKEKACTTPLVIASAYPFTETLRILVTEATDVNVPDEQGITPLMSAKRRLSELEEKLADTTDSPQDLLGFEIWRSNVLENIRFLKEMGAIE